MKLWHGKWGPALLWVLLGAVLGGALVGSAVSAAYENRPLWEGPMQLGRWFLKEAVAVFTVVLAVFTALLYLATDKLRSIGERQSSIAERQVKIVEGQSVISAKAADAAEQSAFASQQAVKATERMAQNAVVSERAYVKMSHPPPGVEMFDELGIYWVQVEIINFGRTPARVTDVWLQSFTLGKDEILPALPQYDRDDTHPTQGFLVSNEKLFHSKSFRIDAETVREIVEESRILWVVGYADYQDIFGARHRAGYARYYVPEMDVKDAKRYPTDDAYAKRNNLLVMPSGAYNYDRSRARGEGNDWDEEPCKSIASDEA